MGRNSRRRNQVGEIWKAKNKGNSAGEHSNKPSANVNDPHGPLFKSVDGSPHAEDAEHKSAERNFWRRQISVAKWLNGITAIAAIVALAGLCFVAIGLKDSRLATEESNRAWLAVDGIDFDFVPPNAIFKPHVVNVGHEPATDALIGPPQIQFVDLPSGDGSMANVHWPKNATCAGAASTKPGTVIYQSPAKGMTPVIAIFGSYNPGMGYDLRQSVAGRRGLLISGCIPYKTFGDWHYTQYCFIGHHMPDGTFNFTSCDEGTYAN